MALTERTLKTLKPSDKPYRRSDRNGLFIEVRPGGRMIWSMAYRAAGKQKTRKIGEYPEVGLAAARADLDRFRAGIRETASSGAPGKPALGDTWDEVAERYMRMRADEGMASTTQDQMRWQLGKVSAAIGKTPISGTTTEDILAMCRREDASGRRETAHRLRSLAERVYNFGCSEGLARLEANPARLVIGALPKKARRHHPAITEPAEVGLLVTSLRSYPSNGVVRLGLLILAHTFLRSSEIRGGRWDEIDWTGAQWIVPARRMKMKNSHIVPLSDQVVAFLAELYRITGTTDLIFPGNRSDTRPISQITFNAALRRLGYDQGTHVPHGFRTTASTLLNEEGWNADWIERQLAHVGNDGVREAYNRAKYLDGRTRMMQAYSDMLDRLEGHASPRGLL